MILSDRHIREAIMLGRGEGAEPLVIDPMPADDCFQPASVELTLANTLINLAKRSWNASDDLIGDMFMYPGQLLLACTREKVTIPDWLVGIVDGKSTLGRQGLAVHITAGYIDPGFSGQITLELRNLGPDPIHLFYGMKICQLRLTLLTSPALRLYGHPGLKSKYQGQTGPTAAR